MEQKALESQADTLAPGFVRALAGAPGTVSGRGLVAGLRARGKHSPVGRLWGHPEKPPPVCHLWRLLRVLSGQEF